MRLRTLPLSESGVILGMFIAISRGFGCGFRTVFFLILTTALLKILSNLSNELGDTLHGTDTSDRQGIHYSLQDGEMTVAEMKRLIACIFVLCCISGLAMIWSSFGTFLAMEPACLILLGGAAIWAAMHYTLGSNPYGYMGLGDLFVFIFFGLVSVLGGYYLCSHDLTYHLAVLPASAVGCWSIGVLNVNNIRDMKTDELTRKTVAMKMGARGARIYQSVLVFLGWALMAIHTYLTGRSPLSWLYFVTLPLFVLHLKGVWSREDRALDPMLPMLVMSTFLTVILMGIFI